MNTAFIVVGLGYGDESKGATVDAITRKYKSDLTVRFNGGPQAAHNVIDGLRNIHHTFSQFGSGTLAGSKTLLSKYMLINPFGIINEAECLEDKGYRNVIKNLFVDSKCQVITPFHRFVNRYNESINNHGTCGIGFGVAVKNFLDDPDNVLYAEDLKDGINCEDKIHAIIKYLNNLMGTKYFKYSDIPIDMDKLVDDYVECGKRLNIISEKESEQLISSSQYPVFEGAQGVLLDQDFGFHPYTTWSSTTPKNALSLLKNFGENNKIVKIGCSRVYSTRHGNGPFITESRGDEYVYKDNYNTYNDWQKNFRVGLLDCQGLKYAANVCGGVDFLSVSHLDQLKLKFCYSYLKVGYGWWDIGSIKPEEIKSVNDMEDITRLMLSSVPEYRSCGSVEGYLYSMESFANAPIAILSNGPKSSDRVWKKELIG